MTPHVHHHPEDQEFTIDQNGASAELAYSQQNGTVDFTHTYVDEELRGQGLAEALAKAGLAYAREQGPKVRTSCEFMAGYVQQHQQEYHDILA